MNSNNKSKVKTQSTDSDINSKIKLSTFIGLTFSLVAGSYYSTLTATGWTMFFYMIVATVGFALPLSLISGEFGTTFPQNGGPELWVSKSLGDQWGFVTSWLIWCSLFPTNVIVASSFAPMLAILFDKPTLVQNSLFTLIIILALYWTITILNLFFDMAKINGKYGIWIGLYIPVVILFFLGIWSFIKFGIIDNSILGDFSITKLFPTSLTNGSSTYFSGIIFIYLGIEISSVFITRLRNPAKEYSKGIVIALILLAIFSLINSFFIANVISSEKLELNNMIQPLQVYCNLLGLPTWLIKAFCVMSIISVVTNMSTWAISPSKSITENAIQGAFPPKFKFWKTNKFNASPTLLIIQAIVISLIATSYILIPGMNNVFIIITNTGTLIYCLAYILIAIGFITIRIKQPNLEHPFRIGKKGNVLAIFLAILLVSTILFALALTFLANSLLNFVLVISFSLVFLIIPLILYKNKKENWKIEIQKELNK